MDPFEKGKQTLNSFQVEIFEECLKRRKGGMSIPMGAGKTLLSLVLSLKQTTNRILVVCAKSLIASWEFEIKKFFGKSLKYEVFHTDKLKKKMATWKPKKGVKVVLTTPDIVAKYYKVHSINKYFVNYYTDLDDPFITIKKYVRPLRPFIDHPMGGGYLFSIRWGSLIIDEIQHYTNINTMRCQGLGAICAINRWALSGTLFNEPKVERILGYYVILDILNSPRSLPDMAQLLSCSAFTGLNSTLVIREKNTSFTPPKVVETIITHRLEKEEAKLYISMKNTMTAIRKKLLILKEEGDVIGVRRFSSFLLAMLTYLRQCLVCPLVPVSSVAIDMADFKGKSELSMELTKQLDLMNIGEWLNNPNAVYSSRMREAVKVINNHTNARIVIFTCFRTCIDVFKSYLPKSRKVFILKPSMNTIRRGTIIADFSRSKNGILLLTYELGAEGLNLQCGSTVLLLDFWWNAGKTKQAIARVLRFGQTATQVNVYLFTSNTGLEKALFEKQKAKLIILEELAGGSWKTKVPKLTIKDIMCFIDMEDNTMLLQNVLHGYGGYPPLAPLTPYD